MVSGRRQSICPQSLLAEPALHREVEFSKPRGAAAAALSLHCADRELGVDRTEASQIYM